MNKIEALRAASKALKDGTVFYDWKKPHSCNCGIVAQAVLGKSSLSLRTILGPVQAAVRAITQNEAMPTWTKMAQVVCPVTGIPENEIFRALHDAGFTAKELCQLEYLSNQDILNRTSIVQGMTFTEFSTTGHLWWKKTVETPKIMLLPHHEDHCNLIRYLDAWADMLEEQAKPEDELEPQLQAVADRLLAKPAPTTTAPQPSGAATNESHVNG
jgi:hypothetical protein